MTDFRLDFEQQTEQPHGFWLSHWQLLDYEPDAMSLPLNAVLEWQDIRFQLLSQQHNHCRFLAQSPINEPFEATNLLLKNNQAWLFLTDITDKLKGESPILITASNQAIAIALNLCQQLKRLSETFNIQVLLHSDAPFPFTVKPAHFMWPDAPAEAIGAAPLLEDWKIPNRLCHTPYQPGCFDGSLEDFLAAWQPEAGTQIIHCNNFLY